MKPRDLYKLLSNARTKEEVIKILRAHRPVSNKSIEQRAREAISSKRRY